MVGRVVTHTVLAQLLKFSEVGLIGRWLSIVTVDGFAVGAHNVGQVIRFPGAAFDLDGGNAACDQFRKLVKETDVIAGKQVLLVIPIHHVSCLAVYEVPLPATRLHTVSPVGAIGCGNPAEITDGPLCDAHVVVQEVFDLDVGLFSDALCFSDGDVAGGYDSRDSVLLEKGGAVRIVDVHHGAGMYRCLDSKLTHQVQ